MMPDRAAYSEYILRIDVYCPIQPVPSGQRVGLCHEFTSRELSILAIGGYQQ